MSGLQPSQARDFFSLTLNPRIVLGRIWGHMGRIMSRESWLTVATFLGVLIGNIYRSDLSLHFNFDFSGQLLGAYLLVLPSFL